MSANCPKCGTYGHRHGGHYVCPICNTTWDTDATVQGNVRSQLHDQMRENANSWNEQKERTYKSFNDTDKAIASAKQVRSNHGYPETKKKKPDVNSVRFLCVKIFQFLKPAQGAACSAYLSPYKWT